MIFDLYVLLSIFLLWAGLYILDKRLRVFREMFADTLRERENL